MNIETMTTIFVIFVFVCAEIYRIRWGKSGVIISIENDGSMASLLNSTMKVRLHTGKEVPATANGCVACMGKLRVGSEVRVSQTRDGWIVHLPWLKVGAGSAGKSRVGRGVN